MPANTAKGFPYPLGTDRVMDGDDAIHNLASKIDTAVGTAASGKATIPITSTGTVFSVAITYPSGRFVNTPAIAVTTLVTNPQNAFASAGTGGGSPTGNTLYGYRASGSGSMDVYWLAVDAA